MEEYEKQTKDKYASLAEKQFLKKCGCIVLENIYDLHQRGLNDHLGPSISICIETKHHSVPTIHFCIKENIDSSINNKLAKNKQKFFKIVDSYMEIGKLVEGCSEAVTKTGIKLWLTLFHR